MRQTAFAVAVLGLWCAAAVAAPTRLYVKSQPSGATIRIDNQAVGVSDDLFIISQGPHTVRIELPGHVTVEKQVEVPAGRITRLEFALASMPPATAPAATRPAHDLEDVEAYLQSAPLDDKLRSAMDAAVRQHPDESQWSGRVDSILFAVAIRSLPPGPVRQRATPALLELAHAIAMNELLTASLLLDQYGDSGLTDSTTLRAAVTNVSGELLVHGRIGRVESQAAVRNDAAVAYVVAHADDMVGYLRQPAPLDLVRRAYRDVAHAQARELMGRHDWNGALAMWKQLHQHALVSQSLYLDAARCFRELGQDADAMRLLSEAIHTFGDSATPGFLEAAGDLAIQLKTEGSDRLAEAAYQAASRKLFSTVTTAATTGPASAEPLPSSR